MVKKLLHMSSSSGSGRRKAPDAPKTKGSVQRNKSLLKHIKVDDMAADLNISTDLIKKAFTEPVASGAIDSLWQKQTILSPKEREYLPLSMRVHSILKKVETDLSASATSSDVLSALRYIAKALYLSPHKIKGLARKKGDRRNSYLSKFVGKKGMNEETFIDELKRERIILSYFLTFSFKPSHAK